MSSSIEGMTPDRLHHASQWFLREATLKAANKAVVDHHHRLPFSRTWGNAMLSSSDGQRFAVQRDGGSVKNLGQPACLSRAGRPG